MRPPREDTKPWYRQFWPWFLIALPGSVVIASMITIYLAANTDDALVKDDYYKQGLAINQDKARERNATKLDVVITLNYDAANGIMRAEINEAAVGSLPQLDIAMAHPTLSSQDASASLEAVAERRFEGPLPLDSSGAVAWHVVVAPPGETWKVRGRWNPYNQPEYVLMPPKGEG
jgi:hypothetical protein